MFIILIGWTTSCAFAIKWPWQEMNLAGGLPINAGGKRAVAMSGSMISSLLVSDRPTCWHTMMETCNGFEGLDFSSDADLRDYVLLRVFNHSQDGSEPPAHHRFSAWSFAKRLAGFLTLPIWLSEWKRHGFAHSKPDAVISAMRRPPNHQNYLVQAIGPNWANLMQTS